MKKSCVLALCFLLVFALFSQPAYALSAEQSSAIQQLVDEAAKVSGTPGISVAVVSDNQTYYFNAGKTSVNSKNARAVDEHTLYEIGSLSKAFTAVGVLLLEEQGLLSGTGRIEDYLPWFHLSYKGETAVVTINNLLNHTSGLSQKHSDAPRGEGADMLRKTVEPFVGAKLDFEPGSKFAYNNANYNILGLIIETVSGQSYEAFMKEQVFLPLGLSETFLYNSDAVATGKMSGGHRHAFFNTFAFDAPEYGGMKPSGFVISSAHDMARWSSIHLGLVEDIPEIFFPVIEKAHKADMNGPPVENKDYYRAGWIIETNTDLLGHSGQTPSFMSNVLLATQKKQSVLFLANNGNVNNALVWNIKSILDGDLQQKYTMSARQIRDIVFFCLLLLFLVSIIAFLAIGIRNRIKQKPEFTKNKMLVLAIWGGLTVFMLVRLLSYPSTTGSGWAYIFDWNPPMATAIQFALPLYFAAGAWHAYTKAPKTPKVRTKK